MRITALVENTRLEGGEDLRPEHGLSLHVSLNGRRILFDTGASVAFAENAEKLGINIRNIDFSVISHHPCDHGGGLAHFLEANENAKVYLRHCKEREYYFRAYGFINKRIGMDRSLFRKYAGRFVFMDEYTESSPGVFRG